MQIHLLTLSIPDRQWEQDPSFKDVVGMVSVQRMGEADQVDRY